MRAAESIPDDLADEEPRARRRESRLRLAAGIALGWAIATTLLPLDPAMPALGLDASWKVAINRATADHLQIVSEGGGDLWRRQFTVSLRSISVRG